MPDIKDNRRITTERIERKSSQIEYRLNESNKIETSVIYNTVYISEIYLHVVIFITLAAITMLILQCGQQLPVPEARRQCIKIIGPFSKLTGSVLKIYPDS